MGVTAKWLGAEAVTVPLLDDGRVEPGETVTFAGDVVDDDPDAAADSVLIEREDGTRHALPLSLWEIAGTAGTVRTIPQVLEAVDGDPVKAAAALTAEQARIKPRQTLVDHLTRIAAMGPATAGPVPVASELPKVDPLSSTTPDAPADPTTEV